MTTTALETLGSQYLLTLLGNFSSVICHYAISPTQPIPNPGQAGSEPGWHVLGVPDSVSGDAAKRLPRRDALEAATQIWGAPHRAGALRHRVHR